MINKSQYKIDHHRLEHLTEKIQAYAGIN